MEVGSHASRAGRREVSEFGHEFAGLIEEFLGCVALHPFFELLDVFRVFSKIRNRNLMSSPGILYGFSVNRFRTRPALRGSQNDHRPQGKVRGVTVSRGV